MCAALVKTKANEVLSDRKHSNNIFEIYNLMQSNTKNQIVCVQELGRIFTVFFERRDFEVDPNLKIASEKEYETELKYVKWLNEAYEKFLDDLYKLLNENSKNVCEIVLETVMKLLRAEAIYLSRSFDKTNPVKLNFPEHRLETYLKYKDIYFYTWKILKKVITDIPESDAFLINVLELMEKIPIKKRSDKKSQSTPPQRKSFCKIKASVQKNAAKVWKELINRKMSLSIHRKLMVILLESFLSNMDNPVYFTDFFMASLNLGGANAILSLQGILILVQKHNIEYPNIYGKLYEMFEANIFHTRYKSRLFHLADIFLSSTHIPEILVASFAKRVARLCLTAQVPDIIIGIRFVQNLIIRHPCLKKLIQHPEQGEVAKDPFLADESDPMKTNATDSSLWEICHLKNHIQPCISSLAGFIDKSLPSIEFNLREVLDTTNEEVFETESRKRLKISISINRPQKIANLSDDKIYKMWMLT